MNVNTQYVSVINFLHNVHKMLWRELIMNYRIRMRNLREDNDLTQREVGAIINKSQQGYSHIEDGRAELKIDDLIKLCQFYKVTADYFIGLSDK